MCVCVQLVIVGDQSTGKSSLLRSLTDIPFPVASGLCTRFATRILSRRTAPGTSNQVKITIVPPNFNVDGDFGYDHTADSEREDYRDYVQVRDALTADEFGRIMEEVSSALYPLTHFYPVSMCVLVCVCVCVRWC